MRIKTFTFSQVLCSLFVLGVGLFPSTPLQAQCAPDVTPPTAQCLSTINVFLNAFGQQQLFPFNINNGSSDNCDPFLDFSLSQEFFGCTDVGNQVIVTMTVTDDAGLSDQCQTTITVFEFIPPVVPCQNITVELDAGGTTSITAADLEAGTGFDDVCGIASVFLDMPDFTCMNIGAQQVTVVVTDNSGNANNCMPFVTVEDNINPTPVCQNTAVVLDANGNASINAIDVDGGSFDNCSIANLTVNPSNFGCSQVGMTLAVLTAIDANGNLASCNASVLVSDITPPNMVCQNIDVFLNDNGEASIVPNDLDGNSFDACGIANLFANKTDFDCDDIPVVPVILTGSDPSGNAASCISMVTVHDNIPAVIGCRPTIHTAADTDVCGKSDVIMLPPLILDENCSVVNISNNAPAVFPVGQTVVTWSIIDAGGNVSNCDQDVLIYDNNPPMIDCGNSFIAYTTPTICDYPSYLLDPPTASDNCGLASVTSDAPAVFSPGNYMVMWTATDFFGNESSCMQWVKVIDLIPPTIVYCPENIVVEATETDGSAQAFFDMAVGFDNCGPIIFSTTSHDSGDYFPLGDTEVIMTLYDGYGISAKCTFTVTVEPVTPSQPLTVDCMPTLEVSIDSEIEIGAITWNSPLTESSCIYCEVNSAEELTHLGFFNGSNYYLYNAAEVTFSQANFWSNFYGGELVIMDDETVNIFLSNEIPVENAWFGLIDNNGDGNLNWADGSEFEIPEWQDEMVDFLDFPSGAVLNTDGTWTLQSLNETAHFIFEVPCLALDVSIENDDEEIVEFALPETNATVEYLAEDECGNQDACEFDIIFTSDVVPYCGSEGVVLEEDNQRYIHKFSIGNFEYLSGNNQGYGDFLDIPVDLIPGEVMQIATNFGPTEMEGPVYCRMWIDLNGDGDFYDAGELVMEGIDEFSMEGDLEIPWPTNDDIEETRMRLSIAQYTFPEPCGNIPNGEVEDYTVRFDTDIDGLVNVTLNGLQNGVATQLHWLTHTNRKIKEYQIQRSINGLNFQPIGLTKDYSQINKSKTYGFLDAQPEKGMNMYRILVTLNSGETFYTNTVHVNYGINPNDIVLMPNPADERIQLSMKSLMDKTAQVKIYNSLGQPVKQKVIGQISNSPTSINLDGLTDGVYQMWIFVEGHRAITKTFVVDKLNGYQPAFE